MFVLSKKNSRSVTTTVTFFLLLLLATCIISCKGWTTNHISIRRSAFPTALHVARYGPQSSSFVPPSDDDNKVSNDSSSLLQKEFSAMIQQCVEVQNPDHIPQIFAKNIELIFQVLEQGNVILQKTVEEAQQSDEGEEKTITVIDTMIGFVEGFAEQAQEMDAANKKLLGKIVQTMGPSLENGGDDAISTTKTAREREDALNALMETHKDQFTPGFLRHIDGECMRIASAPKMTPESARLLEILRMIQTRVLEELGQDLGEAAHVLGQLMGYESNNELIGVLEAGITVRGLDFAKELKELTSEALEGFQQVQGGVDPELVERVQLIDNHLQNHISEQTNSFQ